jgi:hypothetical protein
MSEPTLAWTTSVAKSDLKVFMEDKIWYKFSDQSTLFTAWSTWANASGSTYEKAAVTKYAGGRAMDFRISNKFLTGWPAPDISKTYFQYVTKWSGGCIRDYSSAMGGFCLYEDMDTAFYDCATSSVDTGEAAKTGANAVEICGPLAAGTAPKLNDNANCRALTSNSNAINDEDRGGPINIYWNRVIGDPNSISSTKGTANHFHLNSFAYGATKSGYSSSNGTMMFYRLAAADFTTFEGAWEKSGTASGSLQCDRAGKAGALNKQDGRAFVAAIKAKKVYPGGANKVKYFDYPNCTLDTANSAYEWKCQLYLPAKAKQTAGYPRFEEPGVIIGYYTSSYLPSLKDVSYAKSTEVIQSTGAADLAKGLALVTGVLAVMF